MVLRSAPRYRRRSAALLSQADRAIAPSDDIARRFRRYVPSARYQVRPFEPPVGGAAPPSPASRPGQICVVGAINHQKGYGVLLDCARDAAIGGLPLRFTVVGHTSDDEALIEAGAFVTGPFEDPERDGLVRRQRGSAGFLPSIWPEPWCYALTGLFEAGLPTLCFDIGAQADRMRRAGGSVLPLGSSARDINRELMKLSRLTVASNLPVLEHSLRKIDQLTHE